MRFVQGHLFIHRIGGPGGEQLVPNPFFLNTRKRGQKLGSELTVIMLKVRSKVLG